MSCSSSPDPASPAALEPLPKKQKTVSRAGGPVSSAIVPRSSTAPVSTVTTVPPSRKYRHYSKNEEQVLVEWLAEAANFARWKSSGKQHEAGIGSKSNGEKRTAVARIIAQHIAVKCKTHAFDPKTITQKLAKWEDQYKKVNAWLKGTGEGILDPTLDSGKLTLPTVQEEVVKRFKYFFELDATFSDRPGIEPPSVSETGQNEDGPEVILCLTNAPCEAQTGDEVSPGSDEVEVPAPSADNAPICVESADLDTRSYRDKRLDGDVDSSDSDTDTAAKYVAVLNRKPTKPTKEKIPAPAKTSLTFSQTLITLEKSRAECHAKDLELQRERTASKNGLEKERLNLQRAQLAADAEDREILKAEAETHRLEAENRRMELRIKMRELGLDIN